jgi:thymidylate synthase (FAD)
MGSFTFSSTHYIDYSRAMDNPLDYFVMPIEIMKSPKDIQDKYIDSCRGSIKEYCELIDKGVDPAVARDVLPLSFRSTGIWTVNLRSLQNFLNLRLCGVNTQEINYCAMLVYEEVKKLFPTLYRYFEPDCSSPCCGKCKQGSRMERCIFKGWNIEKMREQYAIIMKQVNR